MNIKTNFGENFKLGLHDIRFNKKNLTSAVTATIFAVAGAIPIFTSFAMNAGLGEQETSSIVMAGMGIGGIISIFLSIYFKQPIYMAPSITSVVVLGPLFERFSLSEMVFGYLMAAIIIFAIGYSGLMGKISRILPLPIVMGMVAGVFMVYGLKLIESLQIAALGGGLTVAAFFIAPSLSKKIPPQAFALLTGIIVTFTLFPIKALEDHAYKLTLPSFILPTIHLDVIAMVSLPLVIMTIADIFKGYGVLKANDYEISLNTITTFCGIGSFLSAFGLGHPMALAGPAIAIISGKEGGPREYRYAAAVLFSAVVTLTVLMAGVVTTFLMSLPMAIISIICGLAMLGLFTSALEVAFGSGQFQIGAFVAFLIGLSKLTLLGIGAPVWAIVFGITASYLMERSSFEVYKLSSGRCLENEAIS